MKIFRVHTFVGKRAPQRRMTAETIVPDQFVWRATPRAPRHRMRANRRHYSDAHIALCYSRLSSDARRACASAGAGYSPLSCHRGHSQRICAR
eukprot:6185928-Pleurochrysis_carterae.AAC.2